MVDLSGGPDGPIEHGFSNSVFIIPGAIIFGLSGEDIGETAIREVLEETSIQTEFESLVAIRYAKRSFFPGCSDMYFVVRLRPITHEISREESEIEDCKWMDIDVFLNHPEVHENNRMFVRQAVENEKEGVLAKREHDIHPVTKAPQFIYSIHKSDL